jgi:hypothetical protein
MPTFQVTCKSCGASNRIPAEKEGIPGKCGECHQPLPALYWQPQQLDEASFDRFVAGFDGPVLAEFWAPW